MATATKNDARMNFRLPLDLKRLIEDAAVCQGQSVTDFAVTSLIQVARTVLDQHNVTRLSNRDREVFLAMLDNRNAKPNKALLKAAKLYKEQIR